MTGRKRKLSQKGKWLRPVQLIGLLSQCCPAASQETQSCAAVVCVRGLPQLQLPTYVCKSTRVGACGPVPGAWFVLLCKHSKHKGGRLKEGTSAVAQASLLKLLQNFFCMSTISGKYIKQTRLMNRQAARTLAVQQSSGRRVASSGTDTTSSPQPMCCNATTPRPVSGKAARPHLGWSTPLLCSHSRKALPCFLSIIDSADTQRASSSICLQTKHVHAREPSLQARQGPIDTFFLPALRYQQHAQPAAGPSCCF